MILEAGIGVFTAGADDPGELTVFGDPNADAGDVDTPLEPIFDEEPGTPEARGGGSAGLGETNSPGVNDGTTPGVVDGSTSRVVGGKAGTTSDPTLAEEPGALGAKAGNVPAEGEDTEETAAPVVRLSEGGKVPGISEAGSPGFATFDDPDEPGLPAMLPDPRALVESPEAPGADNGDDPGTTPSDGLL